MRLLCILLLSSLCALSYSSSDLVGDFDIKKLEQADKEQASIYGDQSMTPGNNADYYPHSVSSDADNYYDALMLRLSLIFSFAMSEKHVADIRQSIEQHEFDARYDDGQGKVIGYFFYPLLTMLILIFIPFGIYFYIKFERYMERKDIEYYKKLAENKENERLKKLKEELKRRKYY